MSRGRKRQGAGRPAAPVVLGGLLLLIPLALSAQPRSMRFERISTSEGLSQATVTSILHDSTGFLWLGTQDGLNRFDGNGFEVFRNDPDNPASLGNNWVRALLEDPSGDIWIATRGGGLNRWRRDSDTFERWLHDPADPASAGDNLQRALLLDRHGFLWVGTEESGLDRFDAESGVFTHYRHDPADPGSLSNDRVRALLEDSAGRLWVATLGGGLNLWQPETSTFRRFRHDPEDPASLNHDEVRALLEDRRGRLWVATHGGLARLDTNTWRFERFSHDPANPTSLSGDRARVLLEDRDGRFWVGTDSGLNLFDRETGSFLHYRYDPADIASLGNDRVSSILESRGGILWVGTQGGGVNKWDPRTWSFANDPMRPPDLSNADVFALSLDSQGHLWIGTSGGGLNRIDRRTGRTVAFRHDPADPNSVGDDRITALLHDRSGTLWIGTLTSGLDRYDPATGAFTHYRHDPARGDSLGADGVMTLFEDPRGRLWLGTNGGGLNRLDRTSGRFRRWLHDPDDPASLSDDRVTAIAQADDGALWLGTLTAGLNRFDPDTGSFLRFSSDPARPTSLSNDTVLGVHVDPRGTVWAGTQRGLNRLESLDPATGEAVFRRFLAGDGLRSDFIYGLLTDEQGRLWVSTNLGLARFDPGTETFRSYDTSHGLQSDEFNMNAYFRGPDGELFFGGINGYNSFYPERIGSNTSVPPVVLTAFSKLNRPVRFDRPVFDVREIVLKHTDNVFSVEFAALDYTAPEKNRYRYRLEGFDPDWVEYGNRRRVTFTNLDPGSYTLRVQGSNNDGVWNQEGLALAVIVTPPFWATWWFRTLLALAAAGLVFLVFTLRTRSIRRRNERLQALVVERTRELEDAQDQLLRRERLAVLGELAGSVAHELRNPLGAIKNSAYYLRLTQQLEGDKAAEHLGLIEKEIDRSNGIITELLDFGRNPQPHFQATTLQRIAERALDKVSLPEEIRLERDLAHDPVAVEVDPDQVERILVNLIRNAAQAMGGSGRLRVGCSVRNGEAVATVADSGPGIERENLERIFEPLFTGKAKGIGLGLPVSLRYARLNRGRIDVESEPGRGATFSLVLPVTGAAGETAAAPPAGQVADAPGG